MFAVRVYIYKRIYALEFNICFELDGCKNKKSNNSKKKTKHNFTYGILTMAIQGREQRELANWLD